MIDPYADRLRVAVPSEAPGGLDSARSGHFGRSPYFTLVDIVDGEITAEIKRVAFDVLAAADAVSARGLPGDVYRAATIRNGKLVR